MFFNRLTSARDDRIIINLSNDRSRLHIRFLKQVWTLEKYEWLPLHSASAASWWLFSNRGCFDQHRPHILSLQHRASRSTWKSDGVAASLGLPVPSPYLEPGPGGLDGSPAGMSMTWSLRKGEELSGESWSKFLKGNSSGKSKEFTLWDHNAIHSLPCQWKGKGGNFLSRYQVIYWLINSSG